MNRQLTAVVSRRSLLKRGVIVTGALVLGNVVTSGTAAADIGEGRVLDFHLNNLVYDRDRGTVVAGRIIDSSPSKNDGEWSDLGTDPIVKDGAVGNAFEFDGSDYIAVPGFPNLTSSLSIAGWVRTRDASKGGQRVFAHEETNANGAYTLSVGDAGSSIRFLIRGSPDLDAPAGLIQNDTWHHVAGVYDDSTRLRRIYIDGVEAATDPSPIPVGPSGSGTASVGGETDLSAESQFKFFGSLDEISVYNRALSAAEIQDLVNMRDSIA